MALTWAALAYGFAGLVGLGCTSGGTSGFAGNDADPGDSTGPGGTTTPPDAGGGGPTGTEGNSVTTVPFSPAAPSSYVAKVKALLTGLAPTAQELQSVQADPNALASLVDTWMKGPAYQDLLLELFGRFFQQNAVTQSDLGIADQQASGGGGVSDWTTQVAVRESFARTARYLVNQGAPFTQTMTTRQFMMNVPLMVYYGVIEGVQVDDDGSAVDLTSKDNPGISYRYLASSAPTDFHQSSNPASANYMAFNNNDGSVANPDARCLTNGQFVVSPSNSRTGITFTENLFHAVSGFDIYSIYTDTYCAGPGGNYSWTEADLTWRMVQVRAPNSNESTSQFWNVQALRQQNELVLRTPRVGFYTTPAFMGQWASNVSNQSRAMVNQTMIVGIGKPFDGSEATVPADLTALDQNRFPKNSSCYGCHLTMDPTRQFFRQRFSFYGDLQTDTDLTSLGGVFTSNGKTAQSSDIAFLGQSMVAHPHFAVAWAKRVCEWASSSTCDEDDPELLRLADAFVASNYSWNALMKATLTSPQVTFASRTLSAQRHGVLVSIARRQQLCRILSSRLGLADICGLDPATQLPAELQPVQFIAASMAGDDFARGQVGPVAVTVPSMTFRAGLENICTILATYFVGSAKTDPYSVTDTQGAVQDLAGTLMGVTGNAQQSVVTKLTQHYNDAVKSGASKEAALQSTFVVACLSPQVTAVGF